MDSIHIFNKMRIAFIIPYFGKFPNYFRLWEYSASKNPDITFFIFTDSKHECSYPNIHYILYSLQQIKKDINHIVGFSVKLESAYKIVDYKPLYGTIFAKYLKGFTHWGYCDSDIIFGNLSHFLTEERLTNYDRIYQHGHLCVYKNLPEINYRWKTKYNLTSYNYLEVFRVKGVKMFDERGGMWDLWKQHGWSQYLNEQEIADILPTIHAFTLSWSEKEQIYHYRNGKIIGYFRNGNEQILQKEFAYIHLQKRKMADKVKNLDDFIISPNLFYDSTEKNVFIFPPSIIQTQEDSIQNLTRTTSLIRRIISALLKQDELTFHLHVTVRRLWYALQGKNWKIRYKLY